MLFLAGADHVYCEKRQKWTRRYLQNSAVSLKRATLIRPPYSHFSKENGGLEFVISKPPFCAARSITTVLLCVSAQMLSKEKSR